MKVVRATLLGRIDIDIDIDDHGIARRTYRFRDVWRSFRTTLRRALHTLP
jgi:hypothetical protein